MLRISVVESGAHRAGFTSVDLAQVVADVVEYYEPLAEEKGLNRIRQPDGIAATMPGDSSLLFEAVGNPIDNDIKFAPSGGSLEVRAPSDPRCTGVEVSDTGPGIPGEERDAVSRSFYHLEQSLNTPGAGLRGHPLALDGSSHHRCKPGLPHHLGAYHAGTAGR